MPPTVGPSIDPGDLQKQINSLRKAVKDLHDQHHLTVSPTMTPSTGRKKDLRKQIKSLHKTVKDLRDKLTKGMTNYNA